MKCPLRVIAIPSAEAEGISAVYECTEEECAWWDEDKNCCSVKVIAKELSAIQLKMPHEGQFRRR